MSSLLQWWCIKGWEATSTFSPEHKEAPTQVQYNPFFVRGVWELILAYSFPFANKKTRHKMAYCWILRNYDPPIYTVPIPPLNWEMNCCRDSKMCNVWLKNHDDSGIENIVEVRHPTFLPLNFTGEIIVDACPWQSWLMFGNKITQKLLETK